MMENRSYSEVVGSPSAPFQTQLSKSYETLTNYFGIGHYSLDNYLAALSGQFYSWSTGDCTPGPSCQSLDPTLATQLDNAQIPWDAYLGSMPYACDQTNYDNGTPGHSYGVRHNPFVYFPSLVKNDCQKIQPSSQLLPDLNSSSAPDFAWFSPEICHDGGGDEPCASIAAGDAFLSVEIPAIQATKWYAQGGVIVLTYDEGNGSGQGQGEYLGGNGNHVLTIVISATTKGKANYSAYVNHFGMLAGLEATYHLPCLAQACSKSNGMLPLPS